MADNPYLDLDYSGKLSQKSHPIIVYYLKLELNTNCYMSVKAMNMAITVMQVLLLTADCFDVFGFADELCFCLASGLVDGEDDPFTVLLSCSTSP